ncbi:MAG: COG1399 protein, clustered with ribosomal protein L32p, partial [uncultured Solirubrobacteraceae bacterium]
GPPHRQLRPRSTAADLRRGPPPRARGRPGPAAVRRRDVRADARGGRGDPRHLGHDAPRLRAEAALRRVAAGAVHALPGARPSGDLRRQPRGRPARRRRGAAQPLCHRRGARRARLGARRVGARAARAAAVPRGLRRAVRDLRHRPQRGRATARARARARSALGQARRDQIRV